MRAVLCQDDFRLCLVDRRSYFDKFDLLGKLAFLAKKNPSKSSALVH